MTVRESRDIVIDAEPKVILDALADVEAFPSWSDIYEDVVVTDRYPDGRPHHASVVLKVMGIRARQLLEFHWGPRWMVWDAIESTKERAGHAEYSLTELLDGGTRVAFHLTVEPTVPLPDFAVARGTKKIMTSLTDGLRQHICGP